MSNELEYLITREYLLINKMIFRDIAQSVIEFFGQEGATMVFFAGVNSGRRSAKKRLKESNGDKKESLRLLTEIKRDQNWAVFVFPELDFENCTGKLWVKRCFCRKGESYQCHFMKGFLTGFFSEVFGNKTRVSLISRDKPYRGSCEIVFKPM